MADCVDSNKESHVNVLSCANSCGFEIKNKVFSLSFPNSDESSKHTLLLFKSNEGIRIEGCYEVIVLHGKLNCLGWKSSSSKSLTVISCEEHAVFTLRCSKHSKPMTKVEFESVEFNGKTGFITETELGVYKTVSFDPTLEICAMCIVYEHDSTKKFFKKSSNSIPLRPCHLNYFDKQHNKQELKLTFVEELTEWKSLHRQLKPSIPTLFFGKKDYAKSFTIRFLINKCLNESKEIAVLDANLRNPLFSPPGTVALTVISKPVLTPFHLDYVFKNFLYQKCNFFGYTKLNSNSKNYLDLVHDAFDVYLSKYKKIPLFVYSADWTSEAEIDVLERIVHMTKSYNIVDFNNFKDLLNVSGASYYSIKTIGVRSNNTKSQLENYFCMSNLYTYKIPWNEIKLHILDRFVYPSQYLYVFNGSIVGLVADRGTYKTLNDESNNEQPLTDTPMFLLDAPKASLSQCMGLGIVKSICMKKKFFYVSTPITLEKISLVNTLVFGNLKLPHGLVYNEMPHGSPYVVSDTTPGQKYGTKELKSKFLLRKIHSNTHQNG